MSKSWESGVGQHVIGQPPRSGCLPLLGLLLVGAVLCALIAWLNWPRP